MVPVIISLLRSVSLGFLRIPRCARCPWIPIFQFISVQFSFAITCLLHYNTHTHTHTHNLQPTTLPNNSSAYSSLSKLLGQPTFVPFQHQNKNNKNHHHHASRTLRHHRRCQAWCSQAPQGQEVPSARSRS